MYLRNMDIVGNRAVGLGNVFVTDVVIHAGITALGDVRGSGVLLMGHGIDAGNIILSDVHGAVIGGDAPGALYSEGKLVLTNSDITGNGVREGYPDIISEQRPVLIRTRCGRSERESEPGVTWGVCSDD